MNNGKKSPHMITFLLLVVGGINWLLVGLFMWDIGEIFGGQWAPISRIIYVLVGLSAIYEIATHKASCKVCREGMKEISTEKPTPEIVSEPTEMSQDNEEKTDSQI